MQVEEVEAHVRKTASSPADKATPSAPTPSPLSSQTPHSSAEEVSAPESSAVKKDANTPPSSIEAVTSNVENVESSSPGSARKRAHEEVAQEPAIVDVDIPVKTKEPLKRVSSVRLAMTADGAVKIKTSDSPTPSPPKERTTPLSDPNKRAKLTRSVSMYEDGKTFREPSESVKRGRMAPNFGRSRDARTWEFYCDNTTDTDLAAQVEAERKGSAVSAINLIRSSSFKSRNAPLSPATTNMRTNTPPVKAGRAKISRAHSSLPRLQAAVTTKGAGGPRQPRRGGQDRADDDADDGNESDKENWLPGTRQSHHRLRRTGPSTLAATRITANDIDAVARSGLVGDNNSNSDENAVPTTNESPTRRSDLAAVQSLLSLRESAWR